LRPSSIPSLVLLLLLLSPATGWAQLRPPVNARKQARATRVTNEPIRVDGRLDEEIWSHAQPLNDFVQKEPDEGRPPSERMEVRLLYDADALYVGARMWSLDPAAIQSPLGRRDSVAQAERFFVSLDTFLDHRTAYSFGVTASGVRLDTFNPSDSRESEDAGFDPVWRARASVDDTGWTAELWIPFSQLRFTELPQQVWGLNIGRFIPTRNEEDDWVLIPRIETAWSSRFGELRGLDGLQPSRRLELLPYVSGGATVNGSRDAANPFDNGRNLTSRVGGDLKMGLGSNLTLDMTVNPDFGQVEADPAVVNLTAFETVFPEKRPFFTEGAGLMNLVVPSGFNLFNSRRIGARPLGPAPGSYVDYPDDSTILAAGKITGRTAGGTSVGLLGAITDRESARVVPAGSSSIATLQVAPRTTYGVGRVQQEFGRAGSTASVMYSGLHRDLGRGDPLAALLSRNALGIGSDAVLRFKNGEYELTLLGMSTYVGGEPAAIDRLQRSSAHYFQRPDRRHDRIDSTRSALTGYKAIVGIERRSGRHWLWDASSRVISPGMESNDMGRVNSGDGVNYSATLRYRQTQPGRLFRNYSMGVTSASEWDFDRDLIGRSLRPLVNVGLKNFWTASASVTRTFRFLDLALTRGGPLMQRPAGWSSTASLGNASSARTRWSASTTLSANEDRGAVRHVNGSISFRPGPRWQVSIDPSFDRTTDAQQYVATLSGGGAGTYGSRYVFAFIQRSTVSTQVRMSFTLKPDVNLDVYAEPFASSGRYYDFGELIHGAGRERLLYGSGGTTVEPQAAGDRMITTPDGTFTLKNRDFNLRSMRSNVVLRWEWRPGSTFYLVWQQNRELRRDVGALAGFSDVFHSLSAPGNDVLSIKTSFWLPGR
jgi:Domain of unknown function (DUF5916)